MPDNDGRTRARLAVSAELARREWSPARLATEAGADPGTIGDFLNGRRWIKLPTQGKIERALEWDAGTLSSIEAGIDPRETVAPADEDDEDLFELKMRRPAGMPLEEWKRRTEEYREEFEWKISRAARER
jgi:hypothetical protein